MLALWMVSAMLVVAYYRFHVVSSALEPIAHFQTACGWGAAFLNRVVFCGFVPGLFLLIPRLRPRFLLATIAAQALWCGLWGIACDWLYTIQCHWFGEGRDWAVLLKKTVVDQFVWTPFFLAPLNALFFFWVGAEFSVQRVRREWPNSFLCNILLPNLVANWIVWIPVLCVVYAFPLPLQVQLSGFAGSFWMLVCLLVGRKSASHGEAQ